MALALTSLETISEWDNETLLREHDYLIELTNELPHDKEGDRYADLTRRLGHLTFERGQRGLGVVTDTEGLDVVRPYAVSVGRE